MVLGRMHMVFQVCMKTLLTQAHVTFPNMVLITIVRISLSLVDHSSTLCLP